MFMRRMKLAALTLAALAGGCLGGCAQSTDSTFDWLTPTATTQTTPQEAWVDVKNFNGVLPPGMQIDEASEATRVELDGYSVATRGPVWIQIIEGLQGDAGPSVGTASTAQSPAVSGTATQTPTQEVSAQVAIELMMQLTTELRLTLDALKTYLAAQPLATQPAPQPAGDGAD